ncbi:MAG TPA: DnaJ domain-containing protein [Candidatus Limnocylindrales bacterium]|nr:DnaJ domain-containing protein [Candidatus Limnocylindrales bacterium]
MAARGSHYSALEVAPTATQREIRAAYRRLARATHPDGHAGDPAMERRFKRIARAYEVLGDPGRRRVYDERATWGRFARPGAAGPQTFTVDAGPIYHSDLGHHSDFYQSGDPLTTTEAATLIRRDAGWLRRAIRAGRLPATRSPGGYLLRRRDVERLDRAARRRSTAPTVVVDEDGASEGMDTI